MNHDEHGFVGHAWDIDLDTGRDAVLRSARRTNWGPSAVLGAIRTSWRRVASLPLIRLHWAGSPSRRRPRD
jgi:hypothetical protein